MNNSKSGHLEYETEVLIIGGGVTGSGVMRDLALRGINCLLVDKRDLNAGASGGNHGLLHSGGRYASSDTETAAECYQEARVLKKIAPDAIDFCGGLFVAVEGDDTDFASKFPQHCADAGIPCGEISSQKARQLEPNLTKAILCAYQVPDASIDPFRLTLANVQQAQNISNSVYLPHLEVTAFEKTNGQLSSALCINQRSGETIKIVAQQFVNATGAWAKKVAELADCFDVDLIYSKGTLIISNSRLNNGVINRLRPPGDGDILVPGGTVSILGTSSDSVDDLENIRPTVAEVDRILSEGIAMFPVLQKTRFIRAFSGVRPLLRSSAAHVDGRKASRGFTLYDHQAQGISNLVTITGGKLTTFRLMSEKTGDLVAHRLGITNPCISAKTQLPIEKGAQWTKPGYSARQWFKQQNSSDLIICECEMVAQSTVDEILDQAPGAEQAMTLRAIGLRSRIGKGTCQGAFCSMRLTSYLYDLEKYRDMQGLYLERDFINERFKGIRPILWGEQMAQIELAESMHCGLMGLDRLQDSLVEEPLNYPDK